MTSLVKKVFRTGSGNKQGSKKEKEQQRSPCCRRKSIPLKPPSPDLTGFNPEEIAVLRDVLKRQEEFELEEIERREKLRDTLQTFEEEVKRSASQKSKLKQVDLRLCRLCYRTKFADGIGKACYDCHKRVCNRCGSFSKPKWNAKKNKSVKGKWRCSMCQMKRDMAAMTGVWYHGNDDEQMEPTSNIQKKLSISEVSSSENDVTYHYSGTDSLDIHSTDIFSSGPMSSPKFNRVSQSSRSSFARRSTSVSEVEPDDVEEEIDGEQFQRERQMDRMQRHTRRSRRRLRSTGSDSISKPEQNKQGGTESDRIYNVSADSDKYYEVSADSDKCHEYSTTTDDDGRRIHRHSSTENRNLSKRESSINANAVQRHRTMKLPKTSDDNNGTDKESDRDSVSYRDHKRDRYHTRKKDTKERSKERDVEMESSMRVYRSNSKESRKTKERQSLAMINYCQGIDREFNQNGNVPLKQANQSNVKKPSIKDGAQKRTKDTNISQKEGASSYLNSIRTSRDSCTSRESRCSQESYTSQGSLELSPTRSSEHSFKNVRVLKKQSATYSSSPSVFSDNRVNEAPTVSLESSEFDKADAPPSKQSSHQTDIEDRSVAQKNPVSRRRESRLSDLSSNSLSPNMALDRHNRNRNRKHRTDDPILPGRSGSVSPKTFSDNEPSTTGLSDGPKNNHGRRMTLSHCDNIFIPDKEHRKSLISSRPHEIILHRDKFDTSVRTNGLGMRVVGGRSGPGGTLGAYVTLITKDGPADSQNISEGDQVIEWNGRSMVDVTFEEAQEIINQSGNLVQISVIHSITDRSTNPSLRRKHPIIIRADTLTGNEMDMELVTPDILFLNKPKRRMLPKTPLEIKREVKNISGVIWIQLDYDMKCQCLLVVLTRGEDILSQGGDSQGGENTRGPNPLAMLHLLPHRTLYDSKESAIKFNTSDPDWNETFVFPDISADEVKHLSLEVTIWNFKENEDEFLGEVLLDLTEAKTDNTPMCYHLEDHDDNSSPLPDRKKSFTLSDTSAISPVNSLDASSIYPSSRNPSPRSSVSTKVDPTQQTVTPAHDKIKELICGRSPGHDRSDMICSSQSSPLHSPMSPGHDFHKRSFASLLKKKIGAVARLSSSLIMGHHAEKPESHLLDTTVTRSQSYNDIIRTKALEVPPQNTPRRSFEMHRERYDLLAPPHPLSRSNTSSEFFGDVDEEGDPPTSTNPDRPAPDGDDITSLLGPGQVAPKPSFETKVTGDIKMGFMVSKGQLEIDIVVVKGLLKIGLSAAPDTYVKTYLVEGSKTVQKKKTQTVRMSYDPIFRKTIKYSACNIHGRCIKVNVWEKPKTFDKKLCLGEAVVKLDNLDLSQHTMTWYKLFPVGATEFDSTESLSYWEYH